MCTLNEVASIFILLTKHLSLPWTLNPKPTNLQAGHQGTWDVGHTTAGLLVVYKNEELRVQGHFFVGLYNKKVRLVVLLGRYWGCVYEGCDRDRFLCFGRKRATISSN